MKNKDESEALRLLRLAAVQGHSESQEELAICYHTGIGVEPSLPCAITWGLKAAKQNCSIAQL